MSTEGGDFETNEELDVKSTETSIKDEKNTNSEDPSLKGLQETDAEIEVMKARLKEMEEEAAKIEAMQDQVEKSLKPSEGGPDIDKRSIYVGNVDYTVTPEELQAFFQSCGTVNRTTILCDKFSGHPKGFAYVEFAEVEGVSNAVLLNESDLKGRPLKINPKRTNLPGFARGGMRARRRPRSHGGYRPRFRRNRRAVFNPYY